MNNALVGVCGIGAILLGGCEGGTVTGFSGGDIGKTACSSAQTLAGVKTAIFLKAREVSPSAEARIFDLEQGSVPRLDQPVVDAVNAETEKVTCSATLLLSLPPGSKGSKGLDEQQKVRLRYSVQPAANKSDMVYEVFGAESLASALAGKTRAQGQSASAASPARGTATAAKPGGSGGLYYIVGLNPQGDNWLALKMEPNLQSRRIAQLGPDTLMTSDGTKVGQWTKVETLDGRYGWVATRHVACCR
jgi:hypothetical protein